MIIETIRTEDHIIVMATIIKNTMIVKTEESTMTTTDARTKKEIIKKVEGSSTISKNIRRESRKKIKIVTVHWSQHLKRESTESQSLWLNEIH